MKFLQGRRFFDKPVRPGKKRCPDGACPEVSGKDDHPCSGCDRPKLRQKCQTRSRRQDQIEDDNVGLFLCADFPRRRKVHGVTNNFIQRQFLDRRSHHFQNRRMVFDDDNPALTGGGAAPVCRCKDGGAAHGEGPIKFCTGARASLNNPSRVNTLGRFPPKSAPQARDGPCRTHP